MQHAPKQPSCFSLGQEVLNFFEFWCSQLQALISMDYEPACLHKRWAIRHHSTEQHSGRSRFHTPLTREYANSPIWACSCRAVPIWPTPTCAGWIRLVTCQLWTNAVTPCHQTPYVLKKTPHTPPTFEFGIRRVLVSDPSQGTHLILALLPPSLTPTTPPPMTWDFFSLVMPPVTHLVS
jgi:hypothetical protein